jgi:nucleoside 2-deoxyribosyltransferase
MNGNTAVNTHFKTTPPAEAYTVYSAGGLFTQDELTANVLIKEAVWRLSGGKFQLFLPQSRELQVLDRPDVVPYIRNTDLLEVVKADIILVRFDGVELDSGTVVEFITAKVLGKPAVILRTDFRRQSSTGLAEPYNLMVKSWPRTVEIHVDCYKMWAELFAGDHHSKDNSNGFQTVMQAELGSIQKSVDAIARQAITGLEAVLEMPSPYPATYQEAVYQTIRFTPGSSFDELLTADMLDEILQRLRNNGTL